MVGDLLCVCLSEGMAGVTREEEKGERKGEKKKEHCTKILIIAHDTY